MFCPINASISNNVSILKLDTHIYIETMHPPVHLRCSQRKGKRMQALTYHSGTAPKAFKSALRYLPMLIDCSENINQMLAMAMVESLTHQTS